MILQGLLAILQTFPLWSFCPFHVVICSAEDTDLREEETLSLRPSAVLKKDSGHRSLFSTQIEKHSQPDLHSTWHSDLVSAITSRTDFRSHISVQNKTLPRNILKQPRKKEKVITNHFWSQSFSVISLRPAQLASPLLHVFLATRLGHTSCVWSVSNLCALLHSFPFLDILATTSNGEKTKTLEYILEIFASVSIRPPGIPQG